MVDFLMPCAHNLQESVDIYHVRCRSPHIVQNIITETKRLFRTLIHMAKCAIYVINHASLQDKNKICEKVCCTVPSSILTNISKVILQLILFIISFLAVKLTVNLDSSLGLYLRPCTVLFLPVCHPFV